MSMICTFPWQSLVLEERKSVARMKKFLNFVGLSVDPEGKFLIEMRRALTKKRPFQCLFFLPA